MSAAKITVSDDELYSQEKSYKKCWGGFFNHAVNTSPRNMISTEPQAH